MRIQLGSKVRDSITGFVGIAVARSVWLWDCARIGVQPQELKDGKPCEEIWFDESRLEVVDLPTDTAAKNKKLTGGPSREPVYKSIEG